MDTLSSYLGVESLESYVVFLHSFVTGNHDTFFVSRSGWKTMTDDLWGEVPWLLRKWEIPSLSAFFYLSVRLIVLASLFFFFFSFFFLICFAISDRLELEDHYQGRVQVALEFALTIEDFDDLVDPHHLYNCCLGLEPSAFVLKKIAWEEKSMLNLSSLLLFPFFL